MNKDIYVFGRHANGIDFQYPEDGLSAVFTNFINHAKTAQSIAIHRKGNLMYYGYIQRISDNSLLGICIVLNDVMLSDKQENLSIFKKSAGSMFSRIDTQALLNIEDKPSSAKNIYTSIEPDLVDLSEELDKLDFITLSPLSFKRPAGSIKEFSSDNDWAQIAASSHMNTYTYTYISDPVKLTAQDKESQIQTQENESLEIPTPTEIILDFFRVITITLALLISSVLFFLFLSS